MKLPSTTRALCASILTATAALLLPAPAARAADHGDAPNMAHDQAADIADVFFFRDPNPGQESNVVIIATFHGFIAPGEMENFGIFDPNIRYHFDIESTGDAKPERSIDVQFGPRTATNAAQTAQLTFTGFGLKGKKAIFGADGSITSTDPTLGDTAPTPNVEAITVGTDTVQFCAGVFDDPFFFDIPAFARFFGVLADDTIAPLTQADFDQLKRGRDSFAGYNCLAIALRLPISALGTPPTADGFFKNKIGVSFATQRKNLVFKKTGEVKAAGGYINADRMGNPAVNVALMPFFRKNEYNAATPLDDAKLRFVGDADHDDDGKTKDPDVNQQKDVRGIVDTLANIGATLGAPVAATPTLVNVAIAAGDYLRLDITTANTGANSEAAFPNGRRLADDTIDTYLFLLSNQALTPQAAPDSAGGDNVFAGNPGGATALRAAFPFLGDPNQPLLRGGAGVPAADTNVDDNTRN